MMILAGIVQVLTGTVTQPIWLEAWIKKQVNNLSKILVSDEDKNIILNGTCFLNINNLKISLFKEGFNE